MAWQDRAYNREERPFGMGNFSFLLPPTPLAIGLMVACLAVFILEAVAGGISVGNPLISWGALEFQGGLAFIEPWRWITYQYLHAGGWHIFANLIGIYFFVPMLEQRWGWRRTLLFYTVGGIFAGITFGLMSAFFHMNSPLVGASGSILAVLGACTAIMPNMRVLMLVFPMTMRTMAVLFGILYLLTIIGDRNTADAAHLGGLIFGFLLVYAGGPFYGRYQRRMHIRRAQKAVQYEITEDKQVDQILQKVHDQGMNSLTRRERHILQHATERQRHADMSGGRRRH
ncbi:MAG: rhomboid family intramembrane serine protease [Phycisphaerales bacterium]|jgi:membrane associated rhomboid family serine protease|nr:rhomboid family intramembrane serine protease [Phycisphaerales bacterium]